MYCGPREVFCLVFDLWFFSDAEKTKMPCHDRCSVSHWTIVKKKKKKKRFISGPCSFPASRKMTPSSVAGCLVRISGSTVVSRRQWSSYPLIIHSGVLSTERPGSFMAVILTGELALIGKKPRLRGCSVFAIKRKQVVRASPDMRIQVARLEPTRRFFFVRLSAKMNPWRWRKAIRKRPRKCNGKSISKRAEQQS